LTVDRNIDAVAKALVELGCVFRRRVFVYCRWHVSERNLDRGVSGLDRVTNLEGQGVDVWFGAGDGRNDPKCVAFERDARVGCLRQREREIVDFVGE